MGLESDYPTCELALVTFSRRKWLLRRLSLLNLCRERLAVSLTTGSFTLSAVGQSGHTYNKAVAGTADGDQQGQRLPERQLGFLRV